MSGADFDLESFHIIDGEFCVAEEFGPFLLNFDKSGNLKEVYDVFVDGVKLLSPDNPNEANPG
ncbi:hypothetical protein CFVI02298_01355 [Campylobacter fetus subsp. venerealis cfvi02/298]|uniref:esterase-like activity of phytase family protein n=1 Tax=Campylobacter fetus TaxID=196 RepID=UPI000068B3FD|nr:hypothetical protein CfvWBT01109_03435 [Campylobacter fetus subsp. venerealis]OCS19374.1 hypothetical protein CFFBT1098_00880 [Campylobacter fetus subsp. fetus BT 10/98]OCS20594.1 hypothetical protein CFVI03596_03905 [Campylobacter fetus subsp. venerealis cfvi03/596]OCS21911.1 hypothetical protein CFVI97532_07330 [Campylobacter fetus subsp. venerealis cfvi97/532]OCS24409.1 hypothetical protein CFVI9825_03725 [Campylobacter fetus subsp. venerealis cfvi9825]OCS26240.1 hypothetical protein CFV